MLELWPSAPELVIQVDPPGPFKAFQHEPLMSLITEPGYTWTGHHAVDGTAAPDYSLIFGRQVGRVERNILSQDHRERNADAKNIVRHACELLHIPEDYKLKVLDLVDRAKCKPQRERAIAALFAARVAPPGTLREALRQIGAMSEEEVDDEYYPFRTMYRCGLAPGAMDPGTAARIYSLHRLPLTKRALEEYGLLEEVERRLQEALLARPRAGGSYRAIAMRALREIDRALGLVNWEEVRMKW
jgi:hypothetical protein